MECANVFPVELVVIDDLPSVPQPPAAQRRNNLDRDCTGKAANTMKRSFILLMLVLGSTEANRCTDVDGVLKQIDAGNGMVFGVNASGSVYARAGNSWILFPGNLKHVTVGPAGVWGIGQNMDVYQLVAGTWFPVTSERLVQVDAGGERFVAGVDRFGSTLCLSQEELGQVGRNRSLNFRSVGSRMRYLSCGPLGCWGVTLAKDVYYRLNVRPSACLGTSWARVFGKFQMIEVATDGHVFGVSITKQLYMRKGITADKPTGWGWTKVQIGNLRFRHVSWDLGHLWLLRDNGLVVRCSHTDNS
ncbi:fish-egg lectin-like [Pristis pectinata]|uniref:fish-egg lectin-like n=1 Tax=Pristis pectinata TaxID=685728 RepID=UPI00223DCF48|nr:fish-egg lectin-like [Pristis pectinata]